MGVDETHGFSFKKCGLACWSLFHDQVGTNRPRTVLTRPVEKLDGTLVGATALLYSRPSADRTRTGVTGPRRAQPLKQSHGEVENEM